MLQSLFVYPMLIIVMLYFSYVGRAKKAWKYMVYGFVAYAIIFGMRYGVGVDYFSYKEVYEVLGGRFGPTGSAEKMEWGYRLFSQALAVSGVHYSVYFGIVAFLQIWITFMAFHDKYVLYPYLVFTFMVSCCMWLTYSNGLRQILVVSLWFCALRLAVERRLWQYYALVAIGLLAHNSAALLLPMYPLVRYMPRDWFKSIVIQFALLAAALVVMKINIIQSLFGRLDSLLLLSGYEIYAQSNQAENVDAEVSIGIGFVITLVVIVLMILYSKRMKDHFDSPLLSAYYNMFFIGVLLKYIFISSNLFGRINYFFINVMFIVLAALLHYAHREDRRLFYVLLCLSVLSFFAVVLKGSENTADFLFFFQDDLHYLKTHM